MDELHQELFLALAARFTLERLRQSGEEGKCYAALLEETYITRGSRPESRCAPPLGKSPA